MDKDSKQMMSEGQKVIGIDMGEVKSHVCELDRSTGEVVNRTTLPTEMTALPGYFAASTTSLIILEVGTHSPWISRLLEQLGRQVIVGNARELRLIYSSKRKNDRLDAEKLARLGWLDEALICQVKHCSQEKQADLAVIRAREGLLKVRQQLAHLPAALEPALLPLVESLKGIQQQINCLNKRIAQLCQQRYGKTTLLSCIKGVGALIALHFVLCLDAPERFSRSRAVGAYVGLVPGQHQSGASNPS